MSGFMLPSLNILGIFSLDESSGGLPVLLYIIPEVTTIVMMLGLYFAKSQLLQILFSFHWKHNIRCKSRSTLYFLLLLERMSLDSLPYLLEFCKEGIKKITLSKND